MYKRGLFHAAAFSADTSLGAQTVRHIRSIVAVPVFLQYRHHHEVRIGAASHHDAPLFRLGRPQGPQEPPETHEERRARPQEARAVGGVRGVRPRRVHRLRAVRRRVRLRLRAGSGVRRSGVLRLTLQQNASLCRPSPKQDNSAFCTDQGRVGFHGPDDGI